MSLLEEIRRRARERPRRIVLAESDEPRTLGAAALLAAEGTVAPVLLGAVASLERAAREQGISLNGVELVGPGASDPLRLAATLVRDGKADGFVAGLTHAGPDVQQTARAILRRPDAGVVSSSRLVRLDRPAPAGQRWIAFADCDLVSDPTAEELEVIALQTADRFRRLCETEPRVALLSFSTHGSADHRSAKKVGAAMERLRRSAPALVADGELQLDAALVPEVAASKAPDSPVGGSANVLVFPGREAARIGCALARRLAGARIVGPLLQGLSHPVHLLDPASSVEEIVDAAALTAVQSMRV